MKSIGVRADFRLIATVATLLFGLIAVGTPAVRAEAEVLQRPTYVCSSGGATVSFSWTALPGALEQWLDISLQDNGFEAGTFLSAGPLPGSVTTHGWPGISANQRHFFRVNQLTASGWVTSETSSFRAPCLPAEVSLGGKDARLSLTPGVYVLDLASGSIQTVVDERGNLPLFIYAQSFDWSPDGDRIAVPQGRNGLKIVEASNGAVVRTFSESAFAADWLTTGMLSVYADRETTSGIAILDPLSGAEQTFHALGSGYSVWSPDGRYLAQVRPLEKGFFIFDSTTNEERLLASGEFYQAAWSPDGKRIASLESHERGEFSTLSILDSTTGETLARLPSGQDVAWSPDGMWIASSKYDEANGYMTLVVDASDGSSQVSLGEGSNPTWSADGTRVAFLRQGHLWLADISSGIQAPLLRPQLPVITDINWSPIRAQIAFRVASSSGIYVVDDSGQNERYIAPGSGPKWSPDGERVAFLFGRGGLGFGGGLYTMRTDGTQIRMLASVGYSDAIPICQSGPAYSWSPDGSALAFWRMAGQDEDSVFVVQDQAEAREQGIGRGYGPEWSQDGAQIVYTTTGHIPCTARIVSLEDGTADVDFPGIRDVSFSPDGSRLLGSRIEGGSFGTVVVQDVNGAGLVTLGRGHDPAWSPDGSSIAYLETEALQPDVVPSSYLTTRRLLVVDADGTSKRTVVEGDIGSFIWAPDGQRIAYTTYGPSGEDGIYVVPVDGSAPPAFIANGYSPSWSPDGRRLIFTR